MLIQLLGRLRSRLKGIRMQIIPTVGMDMVVAMAWVMVDIQAMGDMDTEVHTVVMVMEDGVATEAIMVQPVLCKIIHIVIFRAMEDMTLVGLTGITEAVSTIILMPNRKMKLIWRMLLQWHNQSKEDPYLHQKAERNYGNQKHLIKWMRTIKLKLLLKMVRIKKNM